MSRSERRATLRAGEPIVDANQRSGSTGRHSRNGTEEGLTMNVRRSRNISHKVKTLITIGATMALLVQASVASASVTSTAHDHLRDHLHRAEEPDVRTMGRWSTPFWEGGADSFDPPSLENAKRFPTAVSAVVLPDGRLLYWNGVEGSEDADYLFVNSEGNFTMTNNRARVLDLSSDGPRWTIPTFERGTTDEAQDDPHSATHDIWCSDQKLLYDGTVLVAGGTEWVNEDHEAYGDAETRVFDPATDSFRSVDPMDEPRFYPSLVTLDDGRVLTVGGTRQVVYSFMNPDPAFQQVRLSEVYNPAKEEWTPAGTDRFSMPLYPRLHLLPDGKVFYGGAGEYWSPFGQALDEATWALQRLYDPNTKTWTAVGPSRYTGRSGAASTMLRLEPPYDKADILIAGGTVGVGLGTGAATTLSEVVRWTPDGLKGMGETAAPLAGLAGDDTQLRNARWHSTSVMLPTGEVFLVNGGDTDDAIDPGSAAAVRTAELYDPGSGTWREVATAARERVYHNTAMLLPDGRVLVGGHSPIPAHYTRHDHPVTRASNYKDSTFEIYEPPYLFRGDRPVVDSVRPVENGRGVKLGLRSTTDAADISEVVMVRMAANTHAIDADMRAVRLEHDVAGQNVFAELPKEGDGRILPPGPYYVFVLRNTPDGPVPSIGRTVLVRPTGEGKVAVGSL